MSVESFWEHTDLGKMEVVPVGSLGRRQWGRNWGPLEVSAGSVVVCERRLERRHFGAEEEQQLLAVLSCWERHQVPMALEVAQASVVGRLGGGTNFAYADSPRGEAEWEGLRGARSRSRCSYDCPCCIARI